MSSVINKIPSCKLLSHLKVQDTSTPALIDAEYRKWFTKADTLFVSLTVMHLEQYLYCWAIG